MTRFRSRFTKTEKLICVEKELKMRRWVFPRLISAAKMTEATAAREIALMEAIVEDYREQAIEERLL